MESREAKSLRAYERQSKPRSKMGPLVWALIIQIGLLLAAVFVVVVIPSI